ncbi:MAG: peptidylprolyl isomerase [Acidobacteriota bacterium]
MGTSDGYHIFLVEQVMEEKTFSLDEMTQTVRQHLLAQRKEEAIGRITGNAPLPDGSFVPTEEELRDIAAAGDPEAIALHVGDYALPLRRLLVLSTEAARRPGAAAGGWIPYQMVRALADRERLCLHCVEAKVATHAEAAERVAARRDDLAIDAERRKRLESFVDRHPERLQDFFERSKKRFMTPLRLHVVEISVPPGPDPVATMASLERACAAIDGGESVDDAASALGGRAEDLGFQTLADLRRRDPRAALAAAKLETGKVSAPWTRKGSLVAMRIVERKEPEERELAAVRDQAIASYLEAHQQDVYREVSDEILAGVSFALDRKKLEAAIPARPPAGAPAGELEDGG